MSKTRVLGWDSAFFGMPIADFEPREWLRTPFDIDAFVKKHRIRLLQCCMDVRNTRLINWLEYNSFRFVDLRITLAAPVEETDRKRFRAIPAAHADIPELKRIARTCFKDSRYYAPPFTREQGDRLVETWVEKAVQGTFDDVCFKIEKEGEPVGFITSRYKTKPARIGLVGMRRGYRSQGLGRELLRTLNGYLAGRGINEVRVVTQGKNVGAQNFYAKNGFKIINVAAWFYRLY
jgi:dTDP-4-amino-4,6-dideoxy-D-galactose acyltransferase